MQEECAKIAWLDMEMDTGVVVEIRALDPQQVINESVK
jgi:hypothetical protein